MKNRFLLVIKIYFRQSSTKVILELMNFQESIFGLEITFWIDIGSEFWKETNSFCWQLEQYCKYVELQRLHLNELGIKRLVNNFCSTLAKSWNYNTNKNVM